MVAKQESESSYLSYVGSTIGWIGGAASAGASYLTTSQPVQDTEFDEDDFQDAIDEEVPLDPPEDTPA